MNNIESFSELIDSMPENKKLYEVFQDLECFMLEMKPDQVREIMKNHILTMQKAIQNGLKSPKLSMSGMSGLDSDKISKRYDSKKKLPHNKLFGKLLSYSLAVIEENARMGKIVACPTAGSCGIVPAVIIAYSEELDIDIDKQIDALIIAGGIGKLIAQQVALAGAVAGCQAECGVAASMAAGAIVELLDGTPSMVINAAALALKNTLGLACDPVAGLVEVPCVKRNAFYAVHAASASELALAGVESVIPLDEIIVAMKQIGNLMSPVLKENSEGGLATTQTALRISSKLHESWK